MSLVDIRVDLPTHSRSFTVKVQPSATVLDLKEEIHHTCPGAPRTSGQRLIWRGRMLEDDEKIESLWKTEPRIVHLAVHPSAWSSPPTFTQPQPQPQSQPQLTPTPTIPTQHTPSATSNPTRSLFTTPPSNFVNPQSRSPLAYVLYQHQKALSCLCALITPPPSNIYECSAPARALAVQTVERSGFIWPSILDEAYPPTSPQGTKGIEYVIGQIDGGLFLQLSSCRATPTPVQNHALKVLSVTFTILTLSVSSAPIVRTITPQSTALPPHVNELLQQLGMPPLRAVNGNNGNPGVVANQPNAGMVDIRQIPIRPLLAPLMMLLLRTSLLLYFVAPARTPVFGVLILAWVLYEVWQPIRNGMQNGWGRNPGAGLNQQQQNNAPVNAAHNAGLPNAVPAPGGPGVFPAAANVPVRPGPVGPVTLDLQAGALFDSLANLNIEEEQRLLNQTTGAPTAEPGLRHKITTFLSLFVTTLHPAIWNRRRVALRRREGVVRTEANARNAPPASPPAEGEDTPATSVDSVAGQRREELRAQFNRRPGWIQRYMERVVAEEWVDDSD